AELHLLGECHYVRLEPELLVGPRGASQPDPGLHLVEHEQCIVVTAHRLHGVQELRPHVVVAALALDRLGHEASDVLRVPPERHPGLAKARASARSTSSWCSATGNRTAGTSILGQSNLGNRSVLVGSVLVSDSV